MVRFTRFLATTGLALAGLVLAAPATQAAFNVTAVVGGSAAPGFNYANLDNLPLGTAGGNSSGLNVAFAGNASMLVSGSQTGLYAAPVVSGANNLYFEPTSPLTPTPDTTPYASTGTGTVTLTFASGTLQNYLGLLWGSVDNFNTLTFFNGTTNVGSISGTDVGTAMGAAPNGLTTAYVNIVSTLAFDRVVASSGQNSFEFDNVAFGNTTVPEPSSVVLCGLAGLIGVGVARIRRRTV